MNPVYKTGKKILYDWFIHLLVRKRLDVLTKYPLNILI